MKIKLFKYFSFILTALTVLSCNEKFDITEFENSKGPGNISGDTVYVKLNPDWDFQGFNNPQDVIVGREPYIYVADTQNDRVVLLNLDGQILGERRIQKPVSLAQDYRLNLLVCAEFDTLGQTFSAVYKIDLVAANHQIGIAPMKRILPRVSDLNKPERKYTGVAAFFDNSYHVSRLGPNNTNPIDPDNSILRFVTKSNGTDSLIGRVPLLDPTSSGILSVNRVSRIKSFNKSNYDFMISLTGENNFKIQWLKFVQSPDFTGYQNNLPPAESDLMKPNNFLSPQGLTIDNAGNIYVVETEKDSIYRYNSSGDLILGFGGSSVFNKPYAAAHFDRTLYIADKENNRILRFVLSTDLF